MKSGNELKQQFLFKTGKKPENGIDEDLIEIYKEPLILPFKLGQKQPNRG